MIAQPARPSPPPRRHGPRRRWLGATARRSLAALVLLAGCGDDTPAPDAAFPGLRREVRPVVAERLDPVPPPAFEGPVDDGDLARGERWSVDLEVEPGFTYRILLEHDGPAPALWSSQPPGEPYRPVQLVSGADGRQEWLARATGRRLRLELRAFRGDLTATRLRVRRWALSGAAPDQPAPGELSRLTVGYETRTGWVLPRGRPLTLPLSLPPHATRLTWAAAPLPGTRGDAGTLRLQLRPPDGAEVELLRRPVGRPAADALASDRQVPWSEHAVDVSTWAGQDVELLLSVAGQTDTAQAAVSVPEVLCEHGAPRTNLIVVSIDTLRPDRLDPYGGGLGNSPNLQALAQRGVVFEQARSVSAYTLPSHATLLSGMHPLGHGAIHPGHALDVERVPLVADVLRRQGYATRAFTGGGYLSPDYGFSHGFAAYSVFDPLRPETAAERAWLEQTGATQARETSRRAGDWNAALGWIADRGELPFFAFLHTFTVHGYRPESRDRARFGAPADGEGVDPLRSHTAQRERPYDARDVAQLDALYNAAVATVDRRLGELLELLDAQGLRERTLIVVTSDHGETLSEPRIDGGSHVGHAFGLWHEQVAVPLIVAGPGLAPQRRPELVTLLDVTPTLLELLGLPAHPAMQGVSLAALLRGESGAPRPSPALYDLHSPTNRSRALERDGLKLLRGDPDARVTLPVATPAALFDLQGDPGERRDLADTRPDAVARMTERLQQLVAHYTADTSQSAAVELSPETRQALIELGYIER